MLLTVYLMMEFLKSRELSWVEVLIFSMLFDFLIGIGKSLGKYIFTVR